MKERFRRIMHEVKEYKPKQPYDKRAGLPKEYKPYENFEDFMKDIRGVLIDSGLTEQQLAIPMQRIITKTCRFMTEQFRHKGVK